MEVVAIVVAGIGLVAALVKFATTITERQKAIQIEVAKVHVLVNDQMTRAVERIDQLVEALQAAGMDIPEKHEN